ncbi:hypothetical protein B0H11DRAFT_1007856 [Mycena galericulata]|nr:hypothetical protein B0H11DRAFT_1007856 [Mycena galericulata]
MGHETRARHFHADLGESQESGRVLCNWSAWNTRQGLCKDNARQGPILRAACHFCLAIANVPMKNMPGFGMAPRLSMKAEDSCHYTVPFITHLGFMIWGTIGEYFMRLGPGKFPGRVAFPTSSLCLAANTMSSEASCSGPQNSPGGHCVFFLIGALARFWPGDPFALLIFQAPGVPFERALSG